MRAAPPDLPDGVLVQSIYADEDGRESGWRVWADGRHEHRRAGSAWEQGPRLGEDALGALRSALDNADLESMGGVHRPGTRVRHEGCLWFQAARPRGAVTIALVGGASLTPLEDLTRRLIPILSGGALEP